MPPIRQARFTHSHEVSVKQILVYNQDPAHAVARDRFDLSRKNVFDISFFLQALAMSRLVPVPGRKQVCITRGS